MAGVICQHNFSVIASPSLSVIRGEPFVFCCSEGALRFCHPEGAKRPKDLGDDSDMMRFFAVLRMTGMGRGLLRRWAPRNDIKD